MRRPEPTDGFQLCFKLNLLWESPWAIASLVLLILRFTSGLSGIFWRLAFLAWIGIAYVKTKLIEWAGETSSQRDPERPNKNPYSAKTATRTPEALSGTEEQTAEAVRPAPPQAEGAEVDMQKLQAAIDEMSSLTEETNGVMSGGSSGTAVQEKETS